jgi:hypothetical protein
MIEKRRGLVHVTLMQVRATVYKHEPIEPFKSVSYALPVQVNPYIVMLEPPVDGQPRLCSAERHFQIDERRPKETVFVPYAITEDIPEVVDVRFNASEPGTYSVALDVVVQHGQNRQTYRVLDRTDVYFNKYNPSD